MEKYLNILWYILVFLFTFLPNLLAVAYFTLGERKFLGSIQRREGPIIVGVWGLLQPFADALKLISNEILVPLRVNFAIFFISPLIMFSLTAPLLSLLTFGPNIVLVNVNINLITFLAISGLGVYGIVFSGWASNSRYAYLGSIRAIAQLISYELSLGIVFATVALMSDSFNFFNIVLSQYEVYLLFPLLPLAIVFIIMVLAESNRTPFDLAEAEAELVAGYNVEFSGIIFALFFLAEYMSMLLFAYVFSYMFLGGWLPLPFCSWMPLSSEFWLSFKVSYFISLFVQWRGMLPRYRYDQLMSLGWTHFLPFLFAYFFFILVCVAFNDIDILFSKYFMGAHPSLYYYYFVVDPFSIYVDWDNGVDFSEECRVLGLISDEILRILRALADNMDITKQYAE